MQKHNQTTHSRFESWKVSCYKTLQQMTFLELKAKICYLQPQGKVIINNVWKNLTSTWREEWKKITISLSRAVNVSKIKSLILEMPGHIQLSVIISRWKDHLLSNNTSIDGSKKALVYSMKHPWLNRKKMLSLYRCLASKFPNKPGQRRQDVPGCLCFHTFMYFLSLTNLSTPTHFLRSSHISLTP